MKNLIHSFATSLLAVVMLLSASTLAMATGSGGDCNECDGKVTELTVLYTGNSAAWIQVLQQDGAEVYSGNVEPQQSFSFYGADDWGTLGPNISFYIDSAYSESVHTSCSVEIGPGMIFGDFEIVSGKSRNGGNLCPIGTGGPIGNGVCESGMSSSK